MLGFETPVLIASVMLASGPASPPPGIPAHNTCGASRSSDGFDCCVPLSIWSGEAARVVRDPLPQTQTDSERTAQNVTKR